MDKIDIVASNYAEDDVNFDEFDKLLIEVYTAGFRRGASKRVEISGWFPTNESLPPEGDDLQLLIYDDRCDIPSVCVQVGKRFGVYYIVDNDVVLGDVIGYKPLDKPPTLEICKEMRNGK